MENKRYLGEDMNKKSERIVLLIYTVFTVAMLITAQAEGWSIYAKEFIFVMIVAGWVVYARGYRDYNYRAKFISAMAWMNFFIYSGHSHNFTSMLATMLALIILLGIFCVPEIAYMGMVCSNLVLLYHGFIVKTIVLDSAHDVFRLILHILAMYTVSLVTWITIKTRQETSARLIRNIHDLEIAEQSKDDFMVNISHEIRTPINAVCGMSEAILQEELPVDVRRDVVDIQTAGRNLLSTVSNILDFSELESGNLELAEESYNITSTITDIINMALPLDNGKHLELIVDCDADLPSNLQGDEQKFRRIVMNLLENAYKFTKEGGIVLRITSRKEHYGVNLVVNIKDSGIGMEKADLEKVFTSFSQVNAKRNREEGGVGLGLAITKALIRRMGGFITVKSEPGIGSEFQFTIPQKVLDDAPIVSVTKKQDLFAACYINMDRYNYSVVREGYESCIRHIAEQFGIMMRICRNLPELRRRMERENYSHIFISWDEYCEDKEFFEKLADGESTVVLILDYGQETKAGSNMLRIYKPFTVLAIAAVFNGQRVIQGDGQHFDLKHRFVAPEAKVLVVDDNAMNLKVMARLLFPYQIKVFMAGSGQEALDKLDTIRFDCVFLDHMMPEMDGVETLHHIRQKPGAYFQSLSVIAFTANAIGGAREMFLAEGFNDFIAKPIELSVLERMLRRYIPKQKQLAVEDSAPGVKMDPGKTDAPAPDMQVPEQGEDALAVLDSIGIDVSQGMTYCGDEEGFREILTIYHKDGPKRQRHLEEYFQEKDWKNYVITVHALKSNSKGVGANALAELALSLEMAGKEERIDYILAHHGELMEQLSALLQALSDSLFLYPEGTKQGDVLPDDLEEEEAAGLDKAEEIPQEDEGQPLEEQLVLLRGKLESFESEGIEEILDAMANRKDQQYSGDHQVSLAELAGEIWEKVGEFDFLGASELLALWEEGNRKG